MDNGTIPRIVHQTYCSHKTLSAEVIEKNNTLSQLNPGYEFRYYDDADMENWIDKNCSRNEQSAFYRINPIYGAARADLFRYLLIGKVGGIYLDIKSTCLKPFDSILNRNDKFIFSKWPLGQDGKPIYWQQPGLLSLELYEIQQWWIISVANNPVIFEVIRDVILNLSRNKPGTICNYGRQGVLETTGPIVYTKAVTRALLDNEHREIDAEASGFVYKFDAKQSLNRIMGTSTTHYSQLFEPIIKSNYRVRHTEKYYKYIKVHSDYSVYKLKMLLWRLRHKFKNIEVFKSFLI